MVKEKYDSSMCWGSTLFQCVIIIQKGTFLCFRKYFQEINVLRFKMVSNGRILKNFDEIAHKTPHIWLAPRRVITCDQADPFQPIFRVI